MKLSRVNSCLLAAILLINGYILVLPILPNVLFAIGRHEARQSQLEAYVRQPSPPQDGHTAPAPENQLIIPSMVLDQPVHEGASAATLRQGLWHRPGTSTPDAGGNMVIVGHRLTYTNPRGTLYHLDKVAVNDIVGLRWEGRMYRYKVTTVKTVAPDATDIEAPTDRPQLTIYTCTPLWLPKDRLVVIAEPTEEPNR